MNYEQTLKEALHGGNEVHGEFVELFAKAAARGYSDWVFEKTALIEQGTDEGVAGSPYLESASDPTNTGVETLDEMIDEAQQALSEEGAGYTEEGAPMFSGEDRVASEREAVFNQSFSDELRKLSDTGEPTPEAIVNDVAAKVEGEEALEEGQAGVDQEDLAAQIADEIERRDSPAFAGNMGAR